jgi:alkylhydroperoxidase/carboxymuconolactone decarboxylase family protein YurZ
MVSYSKDKVEERANEIAANRRENEFQLRKASPVYAGMMERTSQVFGEKGRDGGLDQLTRILIALGTAVQAGSESSIDWTITRAVNHGANEAMILDAIDVALLNGGNFAVANARFAFDVLRYRFKLGAGSSEPEFGTISTPGQLRTGTKG